MNSAIPVIPAITKLSSKLIRILGCNPSPMTLQGTNTYIIGNGRKRILLDTGDQGVKEYIKNLDHVLKTENISIDNILLTHWHHDHIGGVKDILSLIKTECKVWKFPRTDASDIYDELPKTIKLCELKDGQLIETEGATVKIVHTPGHTTDHVIALLSEDNSLFSGDCILGEGTAVFEDLYDYMKSLDKILNLSPSIIYPGHGNIINDPIPKIKYYIEHRNNREKQILNVLIENPKKSFNELEIVEIIYKDTPKELYPAAAYNVNHHLQKLTKENKVIGFHQNDQNLWKIKEINSML